MGYRFDSRGSIPGRGKIFSLLNSIHTVSGANQASYPMGIGGCIPGDKEVGA
jgi:hypothetical protein